VSIEQNRALAIYIFNVVFNENKLDLLEELCTPDFICESPLFLTARGILGGQVALKELMQDYRIVHPDMHYTLDEVIAEANKVAISFTYTGTHTVAAEGGKPGHGEMLSVAGLCFCHMTDGKLSRMQFAPYGETRSVMRYATTNDA
jgi:steroid delta-isomerase-like uncharacterized protein